MRPSASMRSVLGPAALALAALFPDPALADDRSACLSAAASGQRLRNAHKLVEARAELLVCAAPSCPAVVQSDCTGWLVDVEAGMPTVVLTATDPSGRDVLGVKATIDGQGPAVDLRGQAMPMDPGQHAVHLEAPDGTTADESVLVKEGTKNQTVAVVVGHAKPPAPPVAVASVSVSDPERASPWRTVGWIAGGAGLVGLGVGVAFGVKAVGDKSAAHCDATLACDAGPLGDANTSATVSTVGIFAGAALLAGGAALVLFGPRPDAPRAANVRLAPTLGAGGAGAAVVGTW